METEKNEDSSLPYALQARNHHIKLPVKEWTRCPSYLSISVTMHCVGTERDIKH